MTKCVPARRLTCSPEYLSITAAGLCRFMFDCLYASLSVCLFVYLLSRRCHAAAPQVLGARHGRAGGRREDHRGDAGDVDRGARAHGRGAAGSVRRCVRPSLSWFELCATCGLIWLDCVFVCAWLDPAARPDRARDASGRPLDALYMGVSGGLHRPRVGRRTRRRARPGLRVVRRTVACADREGRARPAGFSVSQNIQEITYITRQGSGVRTAHSTNACPARAPRAPRQQRVRGWGAQVLSARTHYCPLRGRAGGSTSSLSSSRTCESTMYASHAAPTVRPPTSPTHAVATTAAALHYPRVGGVMAQRRKRAGACSHLGDGGGGENKGPSGPALCSARSGRGAGQ